MPDWFYHPLYRPLVRRALSPATARKLTLAAMALQAQSRLGRAIFGWLAAAPPAAESRAVTAFGLRFPSRIGVAPHIDVDGKALELWPKLGLGFVQIGPVGATARSSDADTEPLTIDSVRCIVTSDHDEGPAADELAARLLERPRAVPLGIGLRTATDIEVVRVLERTSDFFSVPLNALAPDRTALRQLTSSTQRPVLVRLVVDSALDADHLERVVDAAAEDGARGVVLLGGEISSLRRGGVLHGPPLTARALALTERIASRRGAQLPVVGAGGILTPADAHRFLDAGATLVELFEGLVLAGPGLPKRIAQYVPPAPPNATLASPPPAAAASAAAPALASRRDDVMTWCKVGAALVGCAGLVLLAAAVLRLRQLGLPRLWFTPDGTLFEAPAPVRERMEFFVEHNRVCMLGALAGLGTLYLWLSSVPLRRGEAWAWWAVLLSVVAAGASLLTVSSASAPGYRLCGALATALALTGLAASGPAALRSATARALMRPRARAWRWSPAGLGRLWLTVWCLGGVLGGALILVVGHGAVFVPQDLDYIGMSCAPSNLQPGTLRLLATDRILFGGLLAACALAVLVTVWWGIRPGERSLLGALIAIGVVGLVTAIGVHFIIGYLSLTHLLPFLVKDVAFLIGVSYLVGPLLRERGNHFHDLG